MKENYEVRGLVEVLPWGKSRFVWDDAAVGASPITDSYILVVRRKR